MIAPAVVSPWDLWILQGLDPTANADDVTRIIEARGVQNRWEA